MSNKITSAQLKNLLENNQDIFLLDVRSPEEHQAFNIGGMLIPVAELPYRFSHIPKDKPIVVYCRSGHRSEIAVGFLKQAGFQDVKNLEGGMLGW